MQEVLNCTKIQGRAGKTFFSVDVCIFCEELTLFKIWHFILLVYQNVTSPDSMFSSSFIGSKSMSRDHACKISYPFLVRHLIERTFPLQIIIFIIYDRWNCLSILPDTAKLLWVHKQIITVKSEGFYIKPKWWSYC